MILIALCYSAKAYEVGNSRLVTVSKNDEFYNGFNDAPSLLNPEFKCCLYHRSSNTDAVV